jgi:hypothetical protein
MMASIPKLCAMGLHILVLKPGCVSVPFHIRWETPDDMKLPELRLIWPDIVYHPPTGPCTMVDELGGALAQQLDAQTPASTTS